MSDIVTIPPKAYFDNVEVHVLEFLPDNQVFVRVANPKQNLVFVDALTGHTTITPMAAVPSAAVEIVTVGL